MWKIIIIEYKPRWKLTWIIIMNDVWMQKITMIDIY